MLKVGLTGGIGSGKSTVARIFEVLGIPVYYADREAKRLMNENDTLKQNIILKFGEQVYDQGKLNRKNLADLVFNDPEKLAMLNSLVHPATMADSEEWFRKQNSSYCLHEAALIFEAGIHLRLDYVIGVQAPSELRIKRVMLRDNISRDEILKRMARQMDEETKLSKCDFILNNDEKVLLTPRVIELHNKLMSRSNPVQDG